ncbi:MAG: hypothetical protein QM817_32580 [Archangium sp.]
MRIVLGVVLVVLSGCASEKGRAAFSADGTSTTTATLEAGDVDFWTDIDAEWVGSATMRYDIVLEQGGAEVARTSCNPLGAMNVKMSWVETNFGDSHSRSGKGKLGCSVKVPAGGATDVKVTLSSSWPGKVTLKKADLVVKQ